MKPLLQASRCFLILGFILAYLPGLGQTIIRQNTDITELYTDLKTAIDSCVNGDTLYLGPGSYAQPEMSAHELNKQLTLIGAGHAEDNVYQNVATTISGSTHFFTESTGSIFEGICFGDRVTFQHGIISNITFKKCRFGESVFLNDSTSVGYFGNVHDILMRECVIVKHFNLEETKNFLGQNCIFYGRITDATSGAACGKFEHCVFLKGAEELSDLPFRSIDGIIFENCVLACKGECWTGSEPGLNCFNYCAIADQEFTYPGNGNELIIDVLEIYDISPVEIWSTQNDFTPISGSVAINNANDGTDIGVSGGSHPLKANYVPALPYVLPSSTVNSELNPDGTLTINIQVDAQEN